MLAHKELLLIEKTMYKRITISGSIDDLIPFIIYKFKVDGSKEEINLRNDFL
tara:strand:+ start:203 stop:358 length:156 start_codon:yes stop_codon:yes gene_type:complete